MRKLNQFHFSLFLAAFGLLFSCSQNKQAEKLAVNQESPPPKVSIAQIEEGIKPKRMMGSFR
jgi:hypothetical protein